MTPTVDAFQALARSSPWRWTRLHLRHRSARWAAVEAWVVRPGWLLVRVPGRPDRVETGVPYTTSWCGFGPDWSPPARRTPQEVRPALRPDGLVAERPSDPGVEYDDPLFPDAGFTWVAMLDPQELSHHVDVADLRAEERAGRDTWRAVLRAREGYEARCPDCCDLLLGGAAAADPYDVSLDVQTGIVVALRSLAADGSGWFENDVLAVDGEVQVPSVVPRTGR